VGGGGGEMGGGGGTQVGGDGGQLGGAQVGDSGGSRVAVHRWAAMADNSVAAAGRCGCWWVHAG
jgi:hypothetical protein